MRKKMSTAAKIRRMLAKGYEPKEVARRLDCPVQHVYTVRYHENKKLGIGALVTEKPAPIPMVGVVAPKKRGRPRKVKEAVPYARPEDPHYAPTDTSDREKVAGTGPVAIPTKPSMVQRVREWFASWR